MLGTNNVDGLSDILAGKRRDQHSPAPKIANFDLIPARSGTALTHQETLLMSGASAARALIARAAAATTRYYRHAADSQP
ncbi:hypothetical protein KCP77_11100 [Salmonella enterica subsp. enterica]|nr:hypothetical protein KCP77_11100 [Salmonella enterica subsp. enterica]